MITALSLGNLSACGKDMSFIAAGGEHPWCSQGCRQHSRGWCSSYVHTMEPTRAREESQWDVTFAGAVFWEQVG